MFLFYTQPSSVYSFNKHYTVQGYYSFYEFAHCSLFEPHCGLEVAVMNIAMNSTSPTACVIYRWLLWPHIRLFPRGKMASVKLCPVTGVVLSSGSPSLVMLRAHTAWLLILRTYSQLLIRPWLHMLSCYWWGILAQQAIARTMRQFLSLFVQADCISGQMHCFPISGN